MVKLHSLTDSLGYNSNSLILISERGSHFISASCRPDIRSGLPCFYNLVEKVYDSILKRERVNGMPTKQSLHNPTSIRVDCNSHDWLEILVPKSTIGEDIGREGRGEDTPQISKCKCA